MDIIQIATMVDIHKPQAPLLFINNNKSNNNIIKEMLIVDIVLVAQMELVILRDYIIQRHLRLNLHLLR